MLWIVEKTIKKGDYSYVIVKDHPFSTKNGYVLEHRVIMENYLNRVLTQDEVVHHINGDKKDNKIENLVLMDKNEHAKLHAENRKHPVFLKCPWCEKLFTRTKNKTHLTKGRGNRCTCCSRQCSGKLSRSIQLNKNLEVLEKRIKENVLVDYFPAL